MTRFDVSPEKVAARAAVDGEFRLAARYWYGAVEIDLGTKTLRFAVLDGRLATSSEAGGGQTIRLVAPPAIWERILAPVPPPFFNDIMPAASRGLTIEADPETLWQYYPAVRRLIDLLREEVA